MWDDLDRQRQMRVLEAAGMAQASEELLDVAELARELSTSEPVIRTDIGQLCTPWVSCSTGLRRAFRRSCQEPAGSSWHGMAMPITMFSASFRG